MDGGGASAAVGKTGEKGGRERAEKGAFRPTEAEGIPTINVAVSEKIANFFTNTALILQGKNSGYLVKND